MKKIKFSKNLIHYIVIALSIFIAPIFLLSYGTCSQNDINSSMAFAFDNYFKATGQSFIAARFCSDDPCDPIRRSEFRDVSIYQNLWQLSKGPDNSLIRVMEPAPLKGSSNLVYPLTLYPKESPFDDNGAITPTVYSGYDQDFRGDYLDIKIKKLQDQEKQVNWSDFYANGNLENYKTDTHSIMVSENVAKAIISERDDKEINEVTDSDIEGLVGTTIRCKMTKENGTQEPPERELSKPTEERDSDIIESEYFDSTYCRVKKIIGILDNDSAKKYYPIIGDSFIYSIPNTFVSYDYFHPKVYGMFKTNLVGNKTSLRYFMAFSDFAQDHDDYHLNFCDIENNTLKLDGTLQTNYLNCLNFNKSETQLVSCIISIIFGVLFSSFIFLYLIILRFVNEDFFKKRNLTLFFCIITPLILSILLCSFIKSIPFAGFLLPLFSTKGFCILLSIFLIVITCFMLLSHKFSKEVRPFNVSVHNTEISEEKNGCKKQKIINVIEAIVLGVLFGFSAYLLINILITKNSITSIGIPLVSLLLGVFLSLFFKKAKIIQDKKRIDKKLLKAELYDDIFGVFGVLIGLGLSFAFTLLNLIWIPGIDSSLKILFLSFAFGCFLYIICFWIVYLFDKFKNSFISSNSDLNNEKYESIDI